MNKYVVITCNFWYMLDIQVCTGGQLLTLDLVKYLVHSLHTENVTTWYLMWKSIGYTAVPNAIIGIWTFIIVIFIFRGMLIKYW